MDTSDVQVVFGPDQLRRVGQFRYQIYIEEQEKQAAYADHDARYLIEPADHSASTMVFWIERHGIMLGTVRAEVMSAHHEDASSLNIGQFDFLNPGEIVYFSRLMVTPQARRSLVAAKLCWLGFALGLLKGCSLGVLTCRSELVPVFEKFGYLQYADPFMHAEQGLQVPMAILGEVDYLRARGAPLADWLAQYRPLSPYTSRFLSRIAEHRLHLGVARRVRQARDLTV